MLLCGTACHALRDPLHALMGTLELLSEDTTLSQEQQADMNVGVVCCRCRAVAAAVAVAVVNRLSVRQVGLACPGEGGQTGDSPCRTHPTSLSYLPRALQVLQISSRHMQRLVHDVVDLVKMREGSLNIEPEAVRGQRYRTSAARSHISMEEQGCLLAEMCAASVLALATAVCSFPLRGALSWLPVQVNVREKLTEVVASYTAMAQPGVKL